MATDRTSVNKYINYTREAFFLPLHLGALTVLSLATAAAMVALPLVFNTPGWYTLFFLAGAEFLYLGTVTRSKLFRRAINARHAKEILAFEKMQNLTEAYNALSMAGQRRFENFREEVKRSQKRFENANKGFPDMVEDFTARMDDLQISFARLLGDYENGKKILGDTTPEKMQESIHEIEQNLAADPGPLRDMKEKRLKVLKDRLAAHGRSSDKIQMFEDKLSTMEDMAKLMNEQPGNLSTVSHDLESIDSLLTEVRDLHGNLSDIEDIMQEYSLRDRDTETHWEQREGSGEIKV